MRLRERILRDLKFVRGLRRTLKRVKTIASDSANLACDDLEQAVDHHRDRRAVTFEGRTVTYGEFDQIANRYAHWARGQNLRRGQTVALFMPNRLEYPAIWYGLSKVGVAAALINNQLTGAALRHCLDISGATHVLVDGDTLPALQAVRPDLARTMIVWTLSSAVGDLRDLTKSLKSCSQLRPDRAQREGMTAKETCVYIFTSGTTGLPKAARITHTRMQLYMRGFAGATDARPDDRIYVPLPLYHATGGVCAIGAALLNGGSVVLKRKFTASHICDDVVAEDCTMFVYIGELCRYLVNQPEHANERAHKIRLAFGNGLRAEVWQTFMSRFGIPEILEFYGATEGNVSMFNFDGKVGAVGRAPKWLGSRFNFRIVKFDVEAESVVRGADGLCLEAAPDEVGECVGQIGNHARDAYSGYADKIASEKKVLHDVFKRGDAFFATGDLMRQDRDGYFYFVDRIGDTFRWKGENVSTSEVAERLAVVPGVKEATVYGVQVGDQDGRAGMAGLVVGPEFDLEKLRAEVEASLPGYAQPLFVRILPEIETTGTFKYRKYELVADGFNPAQVKGAVYYKHPTKGYVKLTRPTYNKIVSGEMRL
jgi:fatty-acyl-CoA synthase